MQKVKLLTVGIIFIILSFGFMMLLFGTLNHADAVAPIRVACIGDSITQGSGYPAYLQELLGNNYTVGNFGVSGSAVLWKSEKPYVDQLAYWHAITYQPNIVVVMLGTNDASAKNAQHIDDFTDDYMRLVYQLQSLRSNPQIYLVDPPPIHNNTLNLSDSNLVQTVIPRIEDVAYRMNLTLINMHDALYDHPDYFADGVHPTAEGGELIASTINNVINPPDLTNDSTPNYP